jgi:hypothetical protein
MSKSKNLEAKRRMESWPYVEINQHGERLRDYTKEEKEIIKKLRKEAEETLKIPSQDEN